MWIKLLLIALLLFIVFNLFRALFLMLKDDENQPSMSKFLGRRVWWSAIVLLFVILALQFGLITHTTDPIKPISGPNKPASSLQHVDKNK